MGYRHTELAEYGLAQETRPTINKLDLAKLKSFGPARHQISADYAMEHTGGARQCLLGLFCLETSPCALYRNAKISFFLSVCKIVRE